MRLKRNPRKETSTVWDYGTRCDICKKEIRIRHFERADINIQANIGESYPDCDMSVQYRLDCCAKCFLEKVKPLLEERLGVTFQETESGKDSLEEEVP